MSNRRVQSIALITLSVAEIERTVKKVDEGIDLFEEYLGKLNASTTAAQKERWEGEMKKEVKRLQRLRDQIKVWQASNEIKNKELLNETRKRIELLMERFKVLEKDLKIKAYSKEGLSAISKVDPKEREKIEITSWIGNAVDQLKTLIDADEAEMETFLHPTHHHPRHFDHSRQRTSSMEISYGKTVDGPPEKAIQTDGTLAKTPSQHRHRLQKSPRIKELEFHVNRHNYHICKLELVLRMVENEHILPDQVSSLKEFIDDYLENFQNDNYHEDESVYDDFDFSILETEIILKSQLMISNSNLVPGSESDTSSNVSGKSPNDEVISTTTTSVSPSGISGQMYVGKGASYSTTLHPQSTHLPSGQKGQVSFQKLHSSKDFIKGTTETNKLHSSEPSSVAPGSSSFSSGSAKVWSNVPKSIISPEHPSTAKKVHLGTSSMSGTPIIGGGTSINATPVTFPTFSGTATTLNLASTGNANITVEDSTSTTRNSNFVTAGSATSSTIDVSGQSAITTNLEHCDTETSSIPWFMFSTSCCYYPKIDIVTNPFLKPLSDNIIKDKYNIVPEHKPTSDKAKPNDGKSMSMEERISPSTTFDNDFVQNIDHDDPFFKTELFPRYCSFYYYLRIDSPEDACCYEKYNFPKLSPYSSIWKGCLFEKLEVETLFAIFYFLPNTYSQYLAARELKRQSWRYHKKYLTWFQRHEEPKIVTEDYEQGTYVYFDFEGYWCQRKKSEFTFEYRFLEDAELV